MRLEGRFPNYPIVFFAIICRVVGPLLGGFLNKEENIKSIVKLFPIFHDYPYLFPVIIAATLMVLSTIFILFFCKETLPKIDRLASHTEDLAKWGSRSAELKQAFLEENSKTKAPTGWSLLAEKDSILMIIVYSRMIMMLNYSYIFCIYFEKQLHFIMIRSIGKFHHLFLHHNLFGGCYKSPFNDWF